MLASQHHQAGISCLPAPAGRSQLSRKHRCGGGSPSLGSTSVPKLKPKFCLQHQQSLPTPRAGARSPGGIGAEGWSQAQLGSQAHPATPPALQTLHLCEHPERVLPRQTPSGKKKKVTLRGGKPSTKAIAALCRSCSLWLTATILPKQSTSCSEIPQTPELC